MKKQLVDLLKTHYKEFIYQAILFIVLLTFFAFSQNGTEKIEFYVLIFFCNYAICAFLINYILLPKLYYKKKLLWFFIGVSILITLVILIDEFILEQIYFPDTRGKYFPGVLFTLAETLPVIILFVAFKFVWDFHKKQSEVEALQVLVKENELQFLKSQINPHFLFNNLNNLYSYAIENSPKTPSIILELSSVLRYMLYDCREDFVLLSKETDHLKNFTALNELRIENRGVINFNSNIQSLHFKIAPLILTVFVENAFKHSCSSQSRGIFIQIDVTVIESGILTFLCRNSYLSKTNNNHLSSGIGLENVKKRLQILYPQAHELTIVDGHNAFEVILSLELKK